MTNPLIQQEIARQLDQLPLELQQRVLDFARPLNTALPKGVPGKNLLRFAGTISLEDLQAMEAAIEEGCEQVDARE